MRSPRTPQLGVCIEKLWYCEEPSASGWEFVAPTGAAQMVMPLGEGSSAPMVAGVFTGPQPIDASDKRRACGVVFRLGCSGAVVSAPLGALVDQQVELSGELWTGPGSVVDQLTDTASGEQALDGLERILLRAFDQEWRPDPAVTAGVELLDRGVPVRTVVEQLDVDRRRFGKAINRDLGATPKHFARIRRFQRALRATRRSGDVSLGVLAAELGYSDQAHMTRDFREFSGSTPSSVHGLETTSPGHFRHR